MHKKKIRNIVKLNNLKDIKRKIYFLILHTILEPIALIFFVSLHFNKFNLNETFLQLSYHSDDVLKAFFLVSLFFGGFNFLFSTSNYWDKE